MDDGERLRVAARELAVISDELVRADDCGDVDEALLEEAIFFCWVVKAALVALEN